VARPRVQHRSLRRELEARAGRAPVAVRGRIERRPVRVEHDVREAHRRHGDARDGRAVHTGARERLARRVGEQRDGRLEIDVEAHAAAAGRRPVRPGAARARERAALGIEHQRADASAAGVEP
jgi:hypothetical protein